jgi:hypothetical protein
VLAEAGDPWPRTSAWLGPDPGRERGLLDATPLAPREAGDSAKLLVHRVIDEPVREPRTVDVDDDLGRDPGIA